MGFRNLTTMSKGTAFSADELESYTIKGAFCIRGRVPGSWLIEGTGDLKIVERFFHLPLDYNNPDGEKIQVFAREAFLKEKATTPEDEAKLPVRECTFLSLKRMVC